MLNYYILLIIISQKFLGIDGPFAIFSSESEKLLLIIPHKFMN
ncbi:hypothetical protein FFONT_0051 [Fervidicoccus fontis Kam940]|uniref:Uncharacterized protein n=1 Tax=Fervidicoccus fontis (strain DSM 19380 / JCM 18336 / VKM B-2539 / Kam940) TaxID=1163730 RepID=H9ZZ89_FERFK|nr:hypothetical protein FFONT_0051 [Fervidicoccus fontis Kam940]